MPIWEQDSVQRAPAAQVLGVGEQNASIGGCPSLGLLQHHTAILPTEGLLPSSRHLTATFFPLQLSLLRETANYRPAASIRCSYYPRNSCCR